MDKCANPLFAAWIKEWLEEARHNQTGTSQAASNMVFVYKKALDNIMKYPIPLKSGLDAVKVTGIGEKIAQRLEKKIHEHRVSHPDSNSKPQLTNSQSQPTLVLADEILSQVGKKKKKTGELPPLPELPKPKKKRTVKEYVPAYRSGAYAILMALYKHAPASSYMTKAEVIKHAQQYSDSSFDTPETVKSHNNGSRYGYTAWASMKTLAEKDYVLRYGHPPRFCLTEDGQELAQRLALVTASQQYHLLPSTDQEKLELEILPESDSDSYEIIASPPPVNVATKPSKPPITQSNSFPFIEKKENPTKKLPSQTIKHSTTSYEIISTKGSSNSIISVSSDNPPDLPISYVTASGSSTPLKSLALAKIQGGNILFKFRYSLRKADQCKMYSSKIHSLDGRDGDYVIAYMRDQDAPEDFRKVYEYVPPPSSKKSEIVQRKNTSTSILSERSTSSTSVAIINSQLSKRSSSSATSTMSKSSSSNSVDCPIDLTLPSGGMRIEAAPPLDELDVQTKEILRTAKRYPYGSYQVCIALDSREVKNQKDRTFFQNELILRGIPVITQALALGDAMWVAKPFNGDDLVVLDVLVERKTLDDLVSSIKDGRWKEQKYRLNASSIPHVIYLIEETCFDNAQAFGMSAIMSAICTTQVANNFFVKRTSTAEETLDYFEAFTKYLQKKTRDIHAIPSIACTKENLPSIRRFYKNNFVNYSFYFTFDTFQEMNTKSKNLVLKDLFMKQLLTIRGCSAEKCVNIVKIFPTPKSLRDAYMKCYDEKERENLLRVKCPGIGRKAVNQNLSKKIYELFCKEYD